MFILYFVMQWSKVELVSKAAWSYKMLVVWSVEQCARLYVQQMSSGLNAASEDTPKLCSQPQSYPQYTYTRVPTIINCQMD